ncbi:uncharacterized protein LOC143301740 [Babylonia areolata]|uniref:uncharacterized protein LOC143301740 n=1 Tax=Babylonia areolata TaxID=304850 RepID=UPI003FD12318
MERKPGVAAVVVVMGVWVVLAVMVGERGVGAQITKPAGCTHNSGVFTCDFRFVSPLDATGFDPPPQRLVMEEVDGNFFSSHMVNFNQVDQTKFDINYPAELTIICITGGGGVLQLDATSFTGMAFYNEIRIINCDFTSISASAFAAFGVVNHFSLEGGTVNSIDANAFLGLNVIKDTSLPTPKGSFAMIDVDVVSAGLPSGIFSNMTEANEIILSNSRLFTIDLDLFSAATKVTKITLDHNTFTSLPDNLFTGLTALGQVSLSGVPWECTCNNLWFLSHFQDNSIQLVSPSTCTLPSTYFAVDLGGVTCLTVLQLVIYIFAIIGFFGGMAALAIAIQTKRQVGGAGGLNGPAKPGGGPKRGAGNRVSQRPPAGTRPPVKKNAFK